MSCAVSSLVLIDFGCQHFCYNGLEARDVLTPLRLQRRAFAYDVEEIAYTRLSARRASDRLPVCRVRPGFTAPFAISVRRVQVVK